MQCDSIETCETRGLRLCAKFVRSGDRISHVIEVSSASGKTVSMLQSVEGLATEHFPPSPPLQNLSIEIMTGGRRAALLVGMAGRSHWSASIEPAANKAALVFDI